MLVPQEETLEVCVVCRPPGIFPAVLFLRFLVLPAEQRVSLPLGSAEPTSAGSLSRLSIPALSALQLLHVKTFHASLPSSEGCLLPIGPGSQGRAQCPSPTPSPGLTSLISCPLLGHLKLLPLTTIFPNHQLMISIGNEGTNE